MLLRGKSPQCCGHVLLLPNKTITFLESIFWTTCKLESNLLSTSAAYLGKLCLYRIHQSHKPSYPSTT